MSKVGERWCVKNLTSVVNPRIQAGNEKAGGGEEVEEAAAE